MGRTGKYTVKPAKHVNLNQISKFYDKENKNKTPEIQNLAEKLMQLCYFYNIPFVFATAIYNSEIETKYDGAIMVPAAKKLNNSNERIELTNDLITKFCFHMQGFHPDEHFGAETADMEDDFE